MSRIQSRFEQLQQTQKKALIPYVVCGDPKLDLSVEMMHALVAGGADIIELGVPFSDPMAEGPVIQQAHERALAQGTSLTDVFDCVEEFRQQDSDTPVVLMGYANPIEKMGYESFAQRAKSAGVDGVLTVDLPHEEALDCERFLKAQNIDSIFLLTPTTSAARAKSICQLASGYLYYVSLKGVTGAGHLDIENVRSNYQRLGADANIPICVGFGINDASSATAIAGFADGVVIGSALIEVLQQGLQQGNMIEAARTWLTTIRVAIDDVSKR